ncbi:MAG: inorganic phosphate transporter [Planctomycetes bacterium]|nr:inorganic phosphate transporter [Planctomycetota bacterium]
MPLSGGAFLGWSLGANDAANVFGTAVAARVITFRRAVLLCGVAVIAGAVLQGGEGIDTVRDLTPEVRADQVDLTLLVISVAAAVTVTVMTFFRLPVSASQAVVGAIAGVALSVGEMNWGILTKVLVCWVATPLGALVFACLMYWVLAVLTSRPMSILTRDKILWSGLLVVGVYGSYALGANNVANVTGIYSGQFEGVEDWHLAAAGGVAIALGVITYSKRIMLAVGSGIMPLDAFSALVAVSAMSITVHVFAMVGVPVSTSQAIVGAILGIGLMTGGRSMHYKVLRNIGLGWILTPVAALILAAAGYAIFVGSGRFGG